MIGSRPFTKEINRQLNVFEAMRPSENRDMEKLDCKAGEKMSIFEIDEAELKTIGIVPDPTGFGRMRYTHEPTGRAVVCQPYMCDVKWKNAVQEFADKARNGELEPFGSFSVKRA